MLIEQKHPNGSPPEILITIHHKGGSVVYDPNTIIMDSFQNPETFTHLEPLEGKTSIISGKPAICYASSGKSVHLSHEEVYRLVMLALTPQEYFGIREHAGIFHEIHDDFYDEETGEALQSRLDR